MHWLESLLSKPAREVAKSAHLPAPLIARLKSGKPTTLSTRSRKSLYNAHRRNQYATLRKAGVTAAEARKYQTLEPNKLLRYVDMRWRDYEPSEALDVLTLPESQYDKYMTLRDSGATIRQAEDFSTLSTTKVKDFSRQFLDIAETLAKGNGIKVEDILKGMRLSTKVIYDWDAYISLRQRQHWVPLKRDTEVQPGKRALDYQRVPHDSEQYRLWAEYRDGKRPYARDYQKDVDIDL